MFTACNNFVMQSTVFLLWSVTDICGSYSDMAHAVCGFLLTVARRRMTSIIIRRLYSNNHSSSGCWLWLINTSSVNAHTSHCSTSGACVGAMGQALMHCCS